MQDNISNGNRNEYQFGLLSDKSDKQNGTTAQSYLFITRSIILERIGRHEVLLPII